MTVSKNLRKTKIIATIGPASCNPEILNRLIEAGIDCARLNFSHGTLEEHAKVIRLIRELSIVHRCPIAILQDLGGIKLRLGQMKDPLTLAEGSRISLASQEFVRNSGTLPFPYSDVMANMQPGDMIFISDGTVHLEVLAVEPEEVMTIVRKGGVVSTAKGVNLPNVKIDRPILTEADKFAAKFGVEHGVDWIGVSFVRSAEDVIYARRYLESIGSKALIMAKVERREGIENIDAIVDEVDGLMVPRGDMGIEIPMEQVPHVQKEMVRKSNDASVVSVVATQMLTSMLVSATPTRAEVSDIANAVLDGCDAILLSDETAVGKYPVEAVRVADVTIREAEKDYPYLKDLAMHDRTQAIAHSACNLVHALDSKCIVVTNSGRAAIEVSRFRPKSDILVFSHDQGTSQKLALGWGLQPVGIIPKEPDVAKLVAMLVRKSLKTGFVSKDDVVTIVYGALTGISGTTNTIQVLDLKDYLSR